MDPQRAAKQAYKLNPPPAGIYQIRNLRNGKIFIASARNVRGKLNGVMFSLKQKSHYNEKLQADWNFFGAEAFIGEVLDELKPAAGETEVDVKDLQALEALWLEKLQPFGERGYNTLSSGKSRR
jgi:hypothetical protein